MLSYHYRFQDKCTELKGCHYRLTASVNLISTVISSACLVAFKIAIIVVVSIALSQIAHTYFHQ